TSYLGGSGIWIYNNLSTTPKIIENNTIINNSSYTAGTGGISAESAANVIIHNNIIWGNTPIATQIKTTSCTVQATYNDLQNGYTGLGNINTNPLLDSLCVTLSATSPCIDAGDTSSLYNDLTTGPNTAMFPSIGTAHNDMGAYGGPGAFLMHCSKIISGILELSDLDHNISVYPNPATTNLHIKLNQQKIKCVELFTVLGEAVLKNQYNDEAVTLSLSGIVSGFYILKTTSSSGEVEVKK